MDAERPQHRHLSYDVHRHRLSFDAAPEGGVLYVSNWRALHPVGVKSFAERVCQNDASDRLMPMGGNSLFSPLLFVGWLIGNPGRETAISLSCLTNPCTFQRAF